MIACNPLHKLHTHANLSLVIPRDPHEGNGATGLRIGQPVMTLGQYKHLYGVITTIMHVVAWASSHSRVPNLYDLVWRGTVLT